MLNKSPLLNSPPSPVQKALPTPALALSQWKFWGLAILVAEIFMIIGLGGLTRLTDSGLSIVDWRLIMGMIPPLSETAWLETFAQYQAYPEYQLLRPNMSLSEFKTIFTYEYLHRMLGRLIGLTVIGLGVFFASRKALTRRESLHFVMLFILVSSQGLAGWYMVKSGLIQNPHVSHFRLALHFFLALVFMSYAFLLMLAYRKNIREATQSQKTPPQTWVPLYGLLTAFGLLIIQMLYGAFMAGLDAGHISKTYPEMLGKLIPVQALLHHAGTSPIHSFFNNSTWIHFIHRHLGVLTSLVLLCVLLQAWKRLHYYHRHAAKPQQPSDSLPFYGLISALLCSILQPILGIMTVVLSIPVSLALAHQLIAVILTLSLLILFFTRFSSNPPSPRSI